MDTQAEHLQTGALGEDIACRFLEKKGFAIIERNYRKKWGEIDIIAEKSNKIHFVEVKSVSSSFPFDGQDLADQRGITKNNVIRETSAYRPEDAIQPWKIKRLKRAIHSYLLDKKIFDSAKWQFDIIGILIDSDKKISKVRFIEKMIL